MELRRCLNTAKRIVQEVIPHTGGSRRALPFGQFRWRLIPTVVIWVCCLDFIFLPELLNLTPVFTGFVNKSPALKGRSCARTPPNMNSEPRGSVDLTTTFKSQICRMAFGVVIISVRAPFKVYYVDRVLCLLRHFSHAYFTSITDVKNRTNHVCLKKTRISKN